MSQQQQELKQANRIPESRLRLFQEFCRDLALAMRLVPLDGKGAVVDRIIQHIREG